jgi:hypothetical protein
MRSSVEASLRGPLHPLAIALVPVLFRPAPSPPPPTPPHRPSLPLSPSPPLPPSDECAGGLRARLRGRTAGAFALLSQLAFRGIRGADDACAVSCATRARARTHTVRYGRCAVLSSLSRGTTANVGTRMPQRRASRPSHLAAGHVRATRGRRPGGPWTKGAADACEDGRRSSGMEELEGAESSAGTWISTTLISTSQVQKHNHQLWNRLPDQAFRPAFLVGCMILT